MSKSVILKPSSLIVNLLIAAVIVTIVTLYLYFFKFQGNITGFFRIGSELPLSPFLNPATTLIYSGEIGYDGQQFLSLAFDPFLQNSETIQSLDHPIYRYRRIFYPLLSYSLSGGNSRLIPYVMVGLNALFIVLIVDIVSLYFKSYPSPQWQPLFTLCIPGVWIVLSLSTADLLSSLLLITAIFCYRDHKPILTAIALALACLTRETLLLMWLALLITSIYQKKNQQTKQLLWAWLPALFWLVYLNFLNLPGSEGITTNFGFPFFGILQKFLRLFSTGLTANNLFETYLFMGLLAVMTTTLIFSQNAANIHLRFCLIFSAIMLLFTSQNILGYYLDYSRVFIDVYFLLLLSFNCHKIPIKMILFALSGISSFAFLALHS